MIRRTLPNDAVCSLAKLLCHGVLFLDDKVLAEHLEYLAALKFGHVESLKCRVTTGLLCGALTGQVRDESQWGQEKRVNLVTGILSVSIKSFPPGRCQKTTKMQI